MIKLMKYELLKKYKSLLVVLVIFLILQVLQFISVADGGTLALGLSLLNFVLLGMGLIVYLFVNNIRIFSTDLLKKDGYMVFMTPYNGYQIMGAKALAALLENVLFLILYTGFSFLYLAQLAGSDLMDIGRYMTLEMDFDLNVTDILFVFLVGLNVILAWFNLMLSISLAIALYKSILSHVRYGGLISFGFFLIINYLVNKIYSLFMYSDFVKWFFSGSINIEAINIEFLINTLIYFGVGAVLFVATGYLIDKKADF